MYIRTYFEKDTEIRSNTTLNFGKNEVARIESIGGILGNTVSRYLFYFPTDNLQYHYDNCSLGNLSDVRHELVFYPNRKYYNTEYTPANLTFCLVALEQPWNEGCSSTQFEDVGCIGFTTADESANREGAANWFYAQDGVRWQFDGALPLDTSGNVMNVLDCANYSCDDGELRFDVTDWVNLIISGAVENYGFALALSQQNENMPFNGNSGLGFNTSENSTFFKPFLETVKNTVVIDNSKDFTFGADNLLVLNTNIKGSPIKLDEQPILTVFDSNDNPVYVTTGDCIYNGMYGASVNIDGEVISDCDNMLAVWSNLKTNGRTLKDIEVELYPEDVKLDVRLNKPQKITHNHWGIHYDEKIKRGEIKRVFAQSYMPYSQKIAQYDSMWYRIYIIQGNNNIYLMDWMAMNQTDCLNWVDVFTDWMQAQIYYIEFKTVLNGFDYLHENKLRFKIIE